VSLGHDAVGQRLRYMRKRQKLTSQQVADAVGVTRSHLCAIERGAIKSPRLKLVQELARYFDVSLSELVGEPSGTLSDEALRIAFLYDNVVPEKQRAAFTNLFEQYER